MKRPAFQFYPADWRRDAALQSCSVAARGLWIELMCVMHDCEPYGVLSVNGKSMTSAQVARLVGEQEKVVARLMTELEDAGVCSRDGQGRLFSRRMVKDEAVREVRAAGGQGGAGTHCLTADVKKVAYEAGVIARCMRSNPLMPDSCGGASE